MRVGPLEITRRGSRLDGGLGVTGDVEVAGELHALRGVVVPDGPLVAGGDPGEMGDVLFSRGSGASPIWRAADVSGTPPDALHDIGVDPGLFDEFETSPLLKPVEGAVFVVEPPGPALFAIEFIVNLFAKIGPLAGGGDQLGWGFIDPTSDELLDAGLTVVAQLNSQYIEDGAPPFELAADGAFAARYLHGYGTLAVDGGVEGAQLYILAVEGDDVSGSPPAVHGGTILRWARIS